MAKQISYRTIVLSLVLIAVIVFIYYSYQYAVSFDISKYRISSETAKNLIKNKKIDVILDVRTDAERNTLGYYPGSIHIQSADLEKRIKYPKNTSILIYCNTGHRARMAADKLQKMGYKNTVYISSTYKSIM